MKLTIDNQLIGLAELRTAWKGRLRSHWATVRDAELPSRMN